MDSVPDLDEASWIEDVYLLISCLMYKCNHLSGHRGCLQGLPDGWGVGVISGCHASPNTKLGSDTEVTEPSPTCCSCEFWQSAIPRSVCGQVCRRGCTCTNSWAYLYAAARMPETARLRHPLETCSEPPNRLQAVKGRDLRTRSLSCRSLGPAAALGPRHTATSEDSRHLKAISTSRHRSGVPGPQDPGPTSCETGH